MDREAGIIYGCKNNDPRSQVELYNTYKSFVHGFVIKRMKTSEYVDEITSMVFERVFAKINQFNGINNLRPWISVIVKRVMYEVIVKIKKEQSSPLVYTKSYDWLLDNDDTLRDNSNDLHYSDLLATVKNLLNEKELIVFMACYEGYNHKEISELYNMSEGTSKWYLFSARKKIKNKIASGDLVI